MTKPTLVLVSDDHSLIERLSISAMPLLNLQLLVVAQLGLAAMCVSNLENKRAFILVDTAVQDADKESAWEAISMLQSCENVLVLYDDYDINIRTLAHMIGVQHFARKRAAGDDLILELTNLFERMPVSVDIQPTNMGLFPNSTIVDFEHTSPNPTKVANELSMREREILRCLVNGLSNREIASQIQLSEQTVKNYMKVIFGKLGVRNRTQAALWATAHVIHDQS